MPLSLLHSPRQGFRSFIQSRVLRRAAAAFSAWLAVVTVGAADAAPPSARDLFRKSGGEAPASFIIEDGSLYRCDVVNSTASYLLLLFDAAPGVVATPRVVRLAPGARQELTVAVRQKQGSLALSYAIAQSDQPFTTHLNRYPAYRDGETVMAVSVASERYFAIKHQVDGILMDSREKVSDSAMPPDTFIYTAGPYYRPAGLFARDFLYQLEGAGRYSVTAEEVKRAVDYLGARQLTANRKVGTFTYPAGAIPDHVYPDGRFAWGPGLFYGDDTAHFNRPSLDEAMCFVILAWHYGYKANWDSEWKTWFGRNSARFTSAWNSVPLNPATGLVTQWTTPGHIGGNGIVETNAAAVMWGFHDSYGFGGDDIGTSILACNAARALADMHDHAGNPSTATQWSRTADAMQMGVRAQFDPAGYLPWGVGLMAPTMASPDCTGYAVWSGLLTDAQASAASDWLADRYRADRAAGGAADVFHMTAPFRGAVRMARRADDVSPGRHVWPDMKDGKHWENLTFGYDAYQDGGYWYYMSLGIAVTLARNHPDLAREWVGNAYADFAPGGENHPYERIDGSKPQNGRYNASAAALMGMGVPATMATVNLTVGKYGLGTGAGVKNFAVTDDRLVLSPYVWKKTGSGAAARIDAMMPGAYLKALVQGTTTVGLLVDGTANTGSLPAGMPIVDYSIDGGEFVSAQLPLRDEVYVLPLAQELDAAVAHRVDVVFRSATLGARWETTKPHLRLAGLQLVASGTLLPRERLLKTAIAFGDSITEGVLAEGKGPFYADLALNNARVTWAPLVCAALQCELGQLGTGGHGVVRPIQIPPLPKTWDRYDATTSRLTDGRLLPQPDYVFCLLGTNDFQQLESGRSRLMDIKEAYVGWLEAMREACPQSAIFCITPPLGWHAGEISSAVEKRRLAGDRNVYLIDTAPLRDKFAAGDIDPATREFSIKPAPTQFAGDGVHPTVYGNAVLAAFIASEVSRQLPIEPAVEKAK